MKNEKQLQIKKQIAAKHFTAIIERKKYIVEADAKLKETLTKKIELYNKKNSEAKLKEILKLLNPKTEKAKTDLVVAKKKLANEKKSVKKELGQAKQTDSKLTDALAEIEKLKQDNEQKDKELETLRKASPVAKEVTHTPATEITQHKRSGEY